MSFERRIAESRLRHNIENKPRLEVSISVAGSDYAIKFGFDGRLKDALKAAIPQSEITWHKGRKVWLVSPEEIQQAAIVIEKHIGRAVIVPPVDQLSTPEVVEKSFLLEYLGTTKDRGKRVSAYGSVNGEWSAEFPEEILQNFFEGREPESKPDGLQTLYQVLCVVESIEPDKIKSAYRRLARQWHPDFCKEENAAEMFRKINEAYLVLIDPEKKKRYDAGLYFERQSGAPQEPVYGQRLSYGYRSPLRCGQITAKGTVRLMRFIVSEIIKWDDVTDSQGRVMVSSWPKGADTFSIEWLSSHPSSPF